jgi:hypothetical protein
MRALWEISGHYYWNINKRTNAEDQIGWEV